MSARSTRTLLLFLAVAAGFAALAAVLFPSSSSPAPRPEVAPVAVTAAPAVDPLVAVAMPAADPTPEQAETITLAGDLVCEGLTAGVPMVDLTAGLSARYGMGEEEARAFVVSVMDVRGCEWIDPRPSASTPEPAPVTPPAVLAVAAPVDTPAAVPAPVEAPAPVLEEQVQQQLPEEAIGGARCGDDAEVVIALAENGDLICGTPAA